MLEWTIEQIRLPLKFNWAIARSETTYKDNFIVKVSNGTQAGLGECALNGYLGENKEDLLAKFHEFKNNVDPNLNTFNGLLEFFEEIEVPNSLRAGLEMAFIHYLCEISEKDVYKLLGVNKLTNQKTSFSIPMMDIKNIKDFILDHNLARFESLKIKVNQDNATDMISEVQKNYSGFLRVDGNEAWSDVDGLLSFLNNYKDSRIQFFEQPLKASLYEEQKELFKKTPLYIFADESIQSENITDFYKERFHGVNIKLMKSGGYMRALKQLKAARELGLMTMIGCMVETTVGISSAMNISADVDFVDLDGFLLLEKEPYNLLNEENGRLFYASLH